jgi:hypothetical protein
MQINSFQLELLQEQATLEFFQMLINPPTFYGKV